VAWSSTRTWLYGNNAKHVSAWNFVITLAANDYLQLMWSSANDKVQITAADAATAPVRPEIPSVIATLTLVKS
jgi:hypothetical protein